MNTSPFKSFAPQCPEESGVFKPLVDPGLCEGKAACAQVCPSNVFEVKRMTNADFASLTPFERIKSLAHGRKTAYPVRADQCQACGLCVTACPEGAIRMVKI